MRFFGLPLGSAAALTPTLVACYLSRRFRNAAGSRAHATPAAVP